MLVPEYKRALKSILRVLRRDGQVAITSWKSQGHWQFLTRAARKVLGDPDYPPPRFFDEKWLSGDFIEKLLMQIGFRYSCLKRKLMRNVKVHERTHLWKWSSKDAFIRFVGKNRAPSIQMYMAGWTAQQKEDVATCIKDILDDEFPGTEMFHVPMVANIVVGYKV
jgi:ubiquinone/menaquinone biosynthesis C-methylase UbiE